MPDDNVPQTLALAQRRAMVSEMLLRGLSASRIAHRLGIPVEIVKDDEKRLVDDWEEREKGTITRRRAKQFQRISLVEEQAWRAFERSKGSGKNAQGNPTWLKIAIQCIQERNQLGGLYPPKQKHVHHTAQYQPPEWAERIDELSAEEIETLDLNDLERTLRQADQGQKLLGAD